MKLVKMEVVGHKTFTSKAGKECLMLQLFYQEKDNNILVYETFGDVAVPAPVGSKVDICLNDFGRIAR